MKSKTAGTTRLIFILAAALAGLSTYAIAQDLTIISLAEPKFEGVIGTTYKESKEAWPKLPTAPTGAPNVVVILLDDVGFGQSSTFGGPVPTPKDNAKAKSAHTRQYFEVFSNRAIYDNGWMASAQHTFPWRQDYAPGNWDKDKWELYNLDQDFSQANDMAAKNPKKLAEIQTDIPKSWGAGF